MKILITSYGTMGDVRPYVALAKGLLQAGHDVTLATSERFRDFVEGHGISYGHMDDELLSLIDTDKGKNIMENTTNIFDVVKQNILLAKQVKPLQIAQLYETWELAKQINPDFIIYHPKTGAAPHIAEKLGLGCALLTPIPMFVATAERPFFVLPQLKLGGWYNRLSYKIIRLLTAIFLGGPIKNFRSAIGMKPLQKFDFTKNGKNEDIPVLHAMSEVVYPRPSDWPESAYITGYCFLDREEGWLPPAELEEFLDAGPPPIYIGFGSMVGRNPEQLTRIIIEAVQTAQVRAIIATGWGGMRCEHLPSSIFQLKTVPHDYLFPKVSAIVHHGGAGTTGAALRAGKPSVIVPFFGDQPFWGRLIYQLGAGTCPVPKKKLTTKKLAEAIEVAVSDPDVQKRARVMGEKIHKEDGVLEAIAVIEKIAGNR